MIVYLEEKGLKNRVTYQLDDLKLQKKEANAEDIKIPPIKNASTWQEYIEKTRLSIKK